MRIEVTAEDIAQGRRMCPGACPIALALRRAGLVEPDVYPSRGPDEEQPGHEGYVRHGAALFEAKRWCAELPRAASRFVQTFDAGLTVEPFAFDLDLPSPSTERGKP